MGESSAIKRADYDRALTTCDEEEHTMIDALGLAVAFAAGAALWSLGEYVLHRFVFHAWK